MASQPRALEYFDKILQLDKSKIHEEDGELIIAALDVHRAMWAWYNKRKFDNYTQCTKCKKWRVNPENNIAPEDDWLCSMITIDGKPGRCVMPSNIKEGRLEEFSPGQIVWAKCSHYPWWPAIVEDCPSQASYCRIQRQCEEYHVVFFGKEPSRSWLRKDYIICYEKSTYEPFSRCSKQNVKELQLAIQDAEEARKLSYLDRMEKFSFLIRWKDEIPNYVFNLDEDIGKVLRIPFHLKKKDSGIRRSQNTKSGMPRSQNTKSVMKKEFNESDYNKATNSNNMKQTKDGESQISHPGPGIPRSQNTKSVEKKLNASTDNNKAANSNNMKRSNHGESQISDPKPGIPRSQSSKSETTTVSSKRQRNKDEYSAQKPAKIRRKEKGKKDADFSTSEDEWLSSDSDIKLDIKITVNIRSFTELRETASVSQTGILERATPDKHDINYLSYSALRVSSKKC